MPIFGKSSPVDLWRVALVASIASIAWIGVGCDDGTYASSVKEHSVEARSFSWEAPMQLGVFQPNGVKQMVARRGDIPANAYHAVRVNLPESPEKTPPTPEGLTWRVVDVLVDEPEAALSTELDLRHDAYVGHSGRWAADVVAMRSRILAETSEESEVAEGMEERAESLKAMLGQGSPTTGEPFEIPDIEQDRRLRFVWAQRPLLADFALDPSRPLERGLVVTGESDGCALARNWAEGKGVRVVSLEDPESSEIRRFFAGIDGQQKGLPFIWSGESIVAGFEQSKWDAMFHVKQER